MKEDIQTIQLKAEQTPEGTVAFDLGAISAELPCGDPSHVTPQQAMMMDAVQGGGLLRLDAVTGEQMRAIAASQGFDCAGTFGGQPVAADKWYGVLPACRLAVGPFDRKSQAMNGLVLALSGLNPSMRRTEPETIHLGSGPDWAAGGVPQPQLSEQDKRALRALTPEQLEQKLAAFRGGVGLEATLLATLVSPVLGKLVSDAVERTEQMVRDAVHSA